MIFAAGLGTRLRPLTDNLPKALVEINGKPLLQHTIEKLTGEGFDDIVINIHHFAEKIREFIASHDFGKCRISISDESDLLRDTGGGIRHAEAFLNGNGPFLVHNTDIISDVSLRELYSAHMEHGKALATLTVSNRKTERYLLFRKDISGKPELAAWCNTKTGETKSPYRELVHRPDGRDFDIEGFISSNGLKKYAFSGIHVISPEIFSLMSDMPERFPIMDFYLGIAGKYSITCHIAKNNTIIDVGKPDSIEKAENFIKKIVY